MRELVAVFISYHNSFYRIQVEVSNSSNKFESFDSFNLSFYHSKRFQHLNIRLKLKFQLYHQLFSCDCGL